MIFREVTYPRGFSPPRDLAINNESCYPQNTGVHGADTLILEYERPLYGELLRLQTLFNVMNINGARFRVIHIDGVMSPICKVMLVAE